MYMSFQNLKKRKHAYYLSTLYKTIRNLSTYMIITYIIALIFNNFNIISQFFGATQNFSTRTQQQKENIKTFSQKIIIVYIQTDEQRFFA